MTNFVSRLVLAGSKILRAACFRRSHPALCFHSLSTPTTAQENSAEVTQLVPYRKKSTDAQPTVEKSERYSPFQSTSNKADFALARVDDLVNWARKVCAALIAYCCGSELSIFENGKSLN